MTIGVFGHRKESKSFENRTLGLLWTRHGWAAWWGRKDIEGKFDDEKKIVLKNLFSVLFVGVCALAHAHTHRGFIEGLCFTRN